MRQTRYRGVRDPREAGPGQVWIEEIGAGLPGEAVQERALDPRFDLRRHSPDGFQWGYSGSGPAQLALALLADSLGDDELAQRLYQEFKREFVSGWCDRWTVDRQTIRTWAGPRGLQPQHCFAEEEGADETRAAPER